MDEFDFLLGPVRPEDIPDFNSLPPMKRLALAVKMKVAEQETKKKQNHTFRHPVVPPTTLGLEQAKGKFKKVLQ